MENEIAVLLLSDSSTDSEDEQIVNYIKRRQNDDDFVCEILLNAFEKRRRVCIRDYLDDVVDNYSEEEFRRHFRISVNLFNSLIEQFEESADYQNLRQNQCSISARAHIATFLWFAGHEACSFRDVADRFDLSVSSVNRILTRTISFISNMAPNVIVWPNDGKRIASKESFKAKCGFPSVIGK